MSVAIHHGDCLDVLRGMAPASVDACVTDPPYHLTSIVKRFGGENAAPAKSNGPTGVYARASAGFMGKTWDGGDVAMRPETWAEVYRVLKPGAHLVAFGGTRTYHRMACAIEDAGFEIRDQLAWVYGSGFPKSLDVGKAIDKAAGAEREIVGTYNARGFSDVSPTDDGRNQWAAGDVSDKVAFRTAPATEAARRWQGFGTALKPAFEPIVLARKPLAEPTVAANVLRWGTGALCIDGCRVAGDVPDTTRGNSFGRMNDDGWQESVTTFKAHAAGRWPANLCHDGSDEVLEAFAAFGERIVNKPSVRATARGDTGAHAYGFGGRDIQAYADTGTAARFFASLGPDKEELLIWRAKAIMAEWNSELARTADTLSSLSSAAAATALSDAVSWASHGALAATTKSFRGLSTSVTPSELRRISELAITATLIIESECSPGSPLTRRFPSAGPANVVVATRPTGTTTITISHWKSGGSAGDVTFDCTPQNMAVGAKASLRFNYCAKATKAERAGSKHPTVKPLALMRWLVRLVTPPGGLILDPFAGSGTTGLAAEHEGFNAILIEREAEYVADIRRRMRDDAPLFAEVAA